MGFFDFLNPFQNPLDIFGGNPLENDPLAGFLFGDDDGVSAPVRNQIREQAETIKAQMQAQLGEGAFQDIGPLHELEGRVRPHYTNLDLAGIEDTINGRFGQRGLLDIYRQDIQPGFSAIDRQDKLDRAAADQEVLQQYGRDTTDALRDASGTRELMDLLRGRATEELQSDGRLTAGDRREYEQSARSGQAARGLGFGNSDAFLEAMQLGQGRERRRRDQQRFAQSVAGQLQQTGGDPFLALLGRPSQTVGLGQRFGDTAYNQSQNLGLQLFNPESAYAADIYGGNAQAALGASTANAANSTAIKGAVIGAIGNAAGGAAAFCWVAREVYGADNPRWLQFREWMLTQAPAPLRRLYVRHGASLAKWLRGRDEIKARLRVWMDQQIG